MSNTIECPTMVGLTKASQLTGVPYEFLRKLCLQNKIVHIRSGVRYLINLEKLVDYLNQGDKVANG